MNIIGHHTFGCPVFVLKREMQDNQRIMNKWNTRARIGSYMGQSKIHSSKVSLVLNINTGPISPQFHCKIDDQFQSMELINKLECNWVKKCGFNYLSDGMNNTLNKQ